MSDNDIWAVAIQALSEDDRKNFNFSCDKLTVLQDLSIESEGAKERCEKKRWGYKRKNGEKVIFRDVFGNIVKWINLFKEAGDQAIQYDPGHAALPWAAVRVLLQVAVNDINKYDFVVDHLEGVSKYICRCKILERLYLEGSASSIPDFRSNLVRLYGLLLRYLSKARDYFDQNTAVRMIKSALFDKSDFESLMEDIRVTQDDVNQSAVLICREESCSRYSELREVLDKFDAPIRRMADQLKQVQDNLDASKRKEILKWISDTGKIPYPSHHKATKGKSLKGTGRWLLTDQVFKKWKSDSVSSLLWLNGIPGSGKSTLTSLVIEDAIESFKKDLCPRPSYFYCLRDDKEPLRSDSGAIIACIARQLANLQPVSPLLPPVVETYEEEEAMDNTSAPLDLDGSRDLALKLVDQYPVTTIIIDALDECDLQARVILLDFIKSTLENSSSLVKFFVSSRRADDIVMQLKDFPKIDISSTKNQADIETFVEFETRRLVNSGALLATSQSKQELQGKIIEKVSQDAAGMFRWADLQLQNLTTFKTDEDIIDHLGKLPPTLQQLYQVIYDRIAINQGLVSQMIARNVLCFLLRARENLESDDFIPLVAPKSHQGSIEEILAICCNLVVFDESVGVFRFAHLSVREFLEKLPEFAAEKPHSNIVKCCMEQLEGKVLYGSDDSRDLELYISRWVVYHCQIVGPKERREGLDGEIISFLQRNDLTEFQAGDYLKRSNQFILPAPHELDPMAAILFAACGLGFSEVVECGIDEVPTLDIRSGLESQTNPVSQSAKISSYTALRNACWYDLQHLQKALNPQVFQELAFYAAAHGNYHVLELLLRKSLANAGEDVFYSTWEKPRSTSGASWKQDREILALLLGFSGTDWMTPEAMKKIVRYYHGGNPKTSLTLIEMMLSRGLKFPITNDFINSFVLGHQKVHDALLLLIEADSNWDPSSFLERMVKYSGGASRSEWDPRSYRLLLTILQRCDTAAATQLVLQSAAEHHTILVVKSVLEKNSALSITEEVLVGAASNGFAKVSVLEHLLTQTEYAIPQQYITQKVLEVAAKCSLSHNTIQKVLDSNPVLLISESVLECAASNYDADILTYMLHGSEPPLIQPHQLTQRVLDAATARLSPDYIEAILKENPRLAITEETLIAATRHTACSYFSVSSNMLEYLVQRSGLQVTQRIAEAAVSIGWGEGSAKTLNMVLEMYPHLLVTQDMLSVAVEHQDGDLIDVMLRRNPDLEITDGVLRVWERR